MFETIYGVDFSGAKLAGRHAWVARIERQAETGGPPFRLTRLRRLDALAKTAERDPALRHLVRLIAESDRALWALGFPFGLPVEVMDALIGQGASWDEQIAFLRGWGEDAYGVGLECLRQAKELGLPGHVRRLTDQETKAPWDTYSYRIIYQTFYGMRDVLGTVREAQASYGAAPADAAILPFDYDRLAQARCVLVEACPASTLKRLGLPHQNYKQTGTGPLTAARAQSRREILTGLTAWVAIGRVRRRMLMMGDNAGDALDSVIAAVGAAISWDATDHEQIAAHPRYVREGRQYI